MLLLSIILGGLLPNEMSLYLVYNDNKASLSLSLYTHTFLIYYFRGSEKEEFNFNTFSVPGDGHHSRQRN